MIPKKRLLVATLATLVAASCASGEQETGPPDGSTNTDGGNGSDACRSNCTQDGNVMPDVKSGPKLENSFPPYGLTWTPTGDLGRAGGLTWTYTGIQRGSLSHIYWIVCDDPTMPCGLSLNGPITMSSEWQFSMTDSDLPSGKLVFTTSTSIVSLLDAGTIPLSARLTVSIVDSSNAAIPFATVASLGVTARSGQYGAEIKGTGFQVQALAEVEDSITSTWTPYLDYYDAAHTADTGDAGGDAYISFGGSFYDD
jgi:hypothetical protein